MQIQYGELKINFTKTDMDNLIKLKNSLTPGEKIGISLATITLSITALLCTTAVSLKVLDNKKIEDDSEVYELENE